MVLNLGDEAPITVITNLTRPKKYEAAEGYGLRGWLVCV